MKPSSIFKALFLALILLCFILGINTYQTTSNQIASKGLEKITLNKDTIIPRLQKAIQAKTISYEDPELFDDEAFKGYREHIYASFPTVIENLKLELYNEKTMIFKWQGTNSSLKPVAMLNHIDVVPVQEINLDKWLAPPFSGEVIDGYIFGRGTLDTKAGAVANLEAVSLLLEEGFQPERTIYVIHGHDEEVGGPEGNKALVKTFAEKGIQFEFVIDEGGAIIENVLPGITNPTAMIGVAEKGYVSLRLRIETEAGHSSSPPKETAIGIMSKALVKIEQNPVPAKLIKPVELNFSYLAAEFQFPLNVIMSNLWLFDSLLVNILAGERASAPMIRTTSALTVFNSGIKDNVIPSEAEAIVNFRILPGDDKDSIKARVIDLIDDERISVNFTDSFGNNPSRVSSHESKAFKLIEQSIRDTFNQGDTRVYTTPYMLMGGTDSRYYDEVADNVYRFNPILLKRDDMKRFHGINERIGVNEYLDMIRFFHRFIQNINTLESE